jgi:hypothetical protein
MDIKQRMTVIQLGALIALYVSISFTLSILFGVINKLFPDPIETIWQVESANQNIRLGIAMLVVFFPAYITCTYYIQRIRREKMTEMYDSFIKWLIYLSLLAGSIVILGTLVSVIYNFLNGDLTLRFFLKAFSILVLLAVTVTYYVGDLKGYWVRHKPQSLVIAAVSGIIAIGTLTVGILFNDSPQYVRDAKVDAQTLQDLQSIQRGIDDYLEIYGTSTPPNSLEDLRTMLPVEKYIERGSYTYRVTDVGFELCANFLQDARNDYQDYTYITYNPERHIRENQWGYVQGKNCFERTIIKKPEL